MHICTHIAQPYSIGVLKFMLNLVTTTDGVFHAQYPEVSSIFKVSDNAFLSTSMGRLNIPCPSPLPQQHKKVRNIRVIKLQRFFIPCPPPAASSKSTKRWKIFEFYYFLTFARFQEHKSSKYWCWRWSLSPWLRWIIWFIKRADKADMGFFSESSHKKDTISRIIGAFHINCIELEQEKCFQLVDLFFGTVFQVIYRNWVRLILTVKLLTLLAHHPWVIWVVVIITWPNDHGCSLAKKILNAW